MFRLFKASLYLQSSNPSEPHAIENLKALGTLALQRGDHAVFVVASLLEGLSFLRTLKDDAIVRIQGCIAQAAKYQFNESVHISQLDILALMLDLACSLHQRAPQMILQKMKVLQDRMDAALHSKEWGTSQTIVLLPIKKKSSGSQVISEDTGAVLRAGSPDDAYDYLVMSFWSKVEAFTAT